MFFGIPMISAFVPFGSPFTNSSTFHVNMTSVFTIGVCNKIDFVFFDLNITNKKLDRFVWLGDILSVCLIKHLIGSPVFYSGYYYVPRDALHLVSVKRSWTWGSASQELLFTLNLMLPPKSMYQWVLGSCVLTICQGLNIRVYPEDSAPAIVGLYTKCLLNRPQYLFTFELLLRVLFASSSINRLLLLQYSMLKHVMQYCNRCTCTINYSRQQEHKLFQLGISRIQFIL